MPLLSDEIAALVQRTGTNTADLSSQRSRRAFTSNVRADLANVIYQINTVYKPLISALSSTVSLNALDFGLSGNVIFSDVNATSGSGSVYYDSGNSRAKTVKESFDALLTEISELENAVENLSTATVYDDTAVRALITANDNDIDQLKLDTFGPAYTLDGDGAANNTYAVSQVIDALGANFTGYVNIGAGSYTSAYPALSLSVLLSAITLDTTLAQSVITDLSTHLTAIRTFVGMSSATDSSPTYSAYGSLNLLTDGRSLERSLFDLDNALGGHGARHIRGGADEIDGDKLDIDYSPAAYTPTVTPSEVTSAQELTAHLAGIDAELATHVGTHSLQGIYDAVAGATAGNIELDNARGPIEILDDPSSAINQYLAMKDNTGALKYTFSNTGFEQENNTSHTMGVSASSPAAPTDGVSNHSKASATGGAHDELFSTNSNGDVAQITRDGIVREPLVASMNLGAHDWIDLHTGAVGGTTSISPTRGYRHVGAGVSDYMIWNTYEFAQNANSYIYKTINMPKDEDGNYPSRLQFKATFLLDPVGGTAAAGSAFMFGFYTSANSTGSDHQVVNDGDDITANWKSGSIKTYNAHVDPTKYAIIDFDEEVLLSSSDGTLHLRLNRFGTSGSDTYADAICFTTCTINFYR